MSSRPMSRTEAQALGQRIWGYGWQTRLAEALNVQDRTVRRWIAADSIPDFAAGALRAMAAIAPPPATTDADDRDDACAVAIEPELSRIMEMALNAGWHRAEVLTAMLSLVMTDIHTNAGEAALLEILDQARDEIGWRAHAGTS